MPMQLMAVMTLLSINQVFIKDSYYLLPALNILNIIVDLTLIK